MSLPETALPIPVLASHVRVCVCGNYTVFMNLRSGQYFGRRREGILAMQLQPLDNTSSLPSCHSRPIDTLIDLPIVIEAPIGGQDAWRFLLSCARSAFELRWSTFERIFNRIQRRKRLSTAGGIPLEGLRELLGRFDAIRPFFFSRKDSCLLHSLTMVHFLACYGVFPDLIMGVKTEPFEAHSWVQYGGHVLTCSAFQAESFTPILFV